MEITNQVYLLAFISIVNETTLNLLVINSVLPISICQKIDVSNLKCHIIRSKHLYDLIVF